MKVMVSPTGARLTKADHPALPMSLDEIVEATVASAKVGANALHLHVRDADGAHSIDAGLYREALAAIRRLCRVFLCRSQPNPRVVIHPLINSNC